MEGMPTEELALVPVENGYILERVDGDGARSEILLSNSNVLFLPRVAHKAVGQILGRLQTEAAKEQGVEPTISVPARPHSVNESLHGDFVTIEIHDAYGGEFGFELKPDEVQWLGERLIARAEKLRTTPKRPIQ